jgi:hypothetical protein
VDARDQLIESPFPFVLGYLVAWQRGSIGRKLAFRTKDTFESAGLVYDDAGGIVAQEFGAYSIGIALAYLVAAVDPARYWGVAMMGIAINLSAGAMHFLRSAGIYFGSARPLFSADFERKAGLGHAAALVALFAMLPGAGLVS